MSSRRILLGLVLAAGIGACWPLAMRFSGEASVLLAVHLGNLLHSAGLNDKTAFLLVHRLISGAVWAVLLGLGFGLLLALSARGAVLYSWLLFVGAALISSYVVEVLDRYDPWRLSAEWAYPEAWFTVVGIGLFAWLFQRVLSRSVGGSRTAP
jgi:hypothetical protein